MKIKPENRRLRSAILCITALVIQAGFLWYIRSTRYTTDAAKLSLISVLFICSIGSAAWLLNRAFVFQGPLPGNRVSRSTVLVFILIFSVLFVLRGYQHRQFTPVYFSLETKYLEQHAGMILRNPWFIFKTYNAGLAPMYAPVFALTGYNLDASKFFFIGFYTVILVSFYLIFQKRYPGANPFLNFIILAPFSIIIESMRRHKWHSAALIGALAIYLLGLADITRKKWICYAGASLLLALSVIMYHGSLILLPLAVGLTAYDLISRTHFRSKHILISTLILTAGIILFYHFRHHFDYFLKDRLLLQLNIMSKNSTFLMNSWWSHFDVLFKSSIHWVYSLIILFGMAACILRVRTDWYARTSLIGFYFCFTGLLISAYGLENKDENNFIILFLLGILMMGMSGIKRTLELILGQGRRTTACLIILCLSMIYLEWDGFRPRIVLSTDCCPDADLATALLYISGVIDTTDTSTQYVFFRQELKDIGSMTSYEPYKSLNNHPRISWIKTMEDLQDMIRDLKSQSDLDRLILITRKKTPADFQAEMPSGGTILSFRPFDTDRPVTQVIFNLKAAPAGSRI